MPKPPEDFSALHNFIERYLASAVKGEVPDWYRNNVEEPVEDVLPQELQDRLEQVILDYGNE
jgi:hypothetical protein